MRVGFRSDSERLAGVGGQQGMKRPRGKLEELLGVTRRLALDDPERPCKRGYKAMGELGTSGEE